MHKRVKGCTRKDCSHSCRTSENETERSRPRGACETLIYYDFPSEYQIKIRTNNTIERLNREIRRRIRFVGTFLDGNSALMPICAQLRYVVGTQWRNKKYMNVIYLEVNEESSSSAGCLYLIRGCKLICA